MSFEDNFLYPLLLLLIGGGLTGILIPYFNKLHESKLRRLELEHEEAQKRIDTEREDYKFQLEIKWQILEKLSKLNIQAFKDFSILIEKKEKFSDTQSTFLDYLVEISGQMKDYFVLYFDSNKELEKKWSKIFDMCSDGSSMCASEKNSEFRREIIEKFLSEYNIKLDEKGMKKALASNREFPQPIYRIPEEIRELKKQIKNAEFSK